MVNTGILGGNISWNDRYKLIQKHLYPIRDKAIDKGWQHQCFCGSYCYVLWRNRWYCIRCGRWVREFKH